MFAEKYDFLVHVTKPSSQPLGLCKILGVFYDQFYSNAYYCLILLVSSLLHVLFLHLLSIEVTCEGDFISQCLNRRV